MTKIVAIMPLKLQNERLPGKNTKKLGDKPLLQYVLDSLVLTKMLDEIYVYCSDDSIVGCLPQSVKFLKRPEVLDLPNSNFTQIFQSFMNEINADIYVYAHATAPFVTVNTIQECIKAVKSGNYDSAFCAQKIQDFLWQNGQPLNFDATNIPRSQDLEPIYRETSGIYVIKRDCFEKYHRRVGMTPFVKEVTYREAIDINYSEDFTLAERLLDMLE